MILKNKAASRLRDIIIELDRISLEQERLAGEIGAFLASYQERTWDKECQGCGIGFKTDDQRRKYCQPQCGRASRDKVYLQKVKEDPQKNARRKKQNAIAARKYRDSKKRKEAEAGSAKNVKIASPLF